MIGQMVMGARNTYGMGHGGIYSDGGFDERFIPGEAGGVYAVGASGGRCSAGF